MIAGAMGKAMGSGYDWLAWIGASLAAASVLSYFLLSTPLVVGMALATGDPRLVGSLLTISGTILSAVGFGLVFQLTIEQRRKVRAALLFVATLSLSGYFVVGSYFTFPYRIESIRFSNGDVELAGRLMVPRGDGPHPAVVFMHGSGKERGAQNHYLADRFARIGFATLNYDKRGSGASSGGNPRDPFQELAEDALAGLHDLSRRPDMDSHNIGLWGMSESGWVAPLAASRSTNVSFLIVVSGAGASVEMENYYFIENRLIGKGFSDSEAAQAVGLRRQINEYYRSGTGREEALDAVRRMQREPWYSEARLLPQGPDDVCIYGSNCANQYLSAIEFDATPLLESLDIPMLFIFGEEDKSHPVDDSVAILHQQLVSQGGKDVTVVVLPDADHSMLVWNDRLPRLAHDYIDTMTDWLLERVPGIEPTQLESLPVRRDGSKT